MQTIAKTSYQTIAKRAIGDPSFANDQFYLDLVQTTRQSFEKLNVNGQLAVEAAFIFSRKAPQTERQDLFQELLTAVLASGTENSAFAYAIVRRDWQNWYESYKLHSQYHEGYLSETITNAEGQETELSELLVGEIEFERKQIDKLDGEQLWQQIPKAIQALVQKRLQGKPLGAPRKHKAGAPKSGATLNNTERSRLNRYVKTEGYKLLIN